MGTFPKRERKMPATAQADLVKRGTVLFHHPYKVYYALLPRHGATPACAMVISVPKRNFKRAVDRNRIKRQVREAFRNNNTLLKSELNKKCGRIQMLCVYLPHEHAPTSLLFHKMASLLARLAQCVSQSDTLATFSVD